MQIEQFDSRNEMDDEPGNCGTGWERNRELCLEECFQQILINTKTTCFLCSDLCILEFLINGSLYLLLALV